MIMNRIDILRTYQNHKILLTVTPFEFFNAKKNSRSIVSEYKQVNVSFFTLFAVKLSFVQRILKIVHRFLQQITSCFSL